MDSPTDGHGVSKKWVIAEAVGLRHAPGPLAQFAHVDLVNWMPFIQERRGRDFTHMYDPLTVAALARPELVRRGERMAVRIEGRGEFTSA